LKNSDHYKEIWFVDFEFNQPDGECPNPICMVAREFFTKKTIRIWGYELHSLTKAPFPTDESSLFVAYFASAEIGCFLSLGWPVPKRILDLYVEFKNHTCGKFVPTGFGLLSALGYFGLPAIDVAEKGAMRDLILRGGPFTDPEVVLILDYCETDVVACDKLFSVMENLIDLPRALIRGRYMAAVARMEKDGVPIDVEYLQIFQQNWKDIQGNLIARIDKEYGVYDGLTFKIDRWKEWLENRKIPWPVLPSGQLALDEETFRSVAKTHPVVKPIHELRSTISKLRLNSLTVGKDGRNRCMLSPFQSKTSRNQPSNTKFVFGPSSWLRFLIKPTEGTALAYIDFSQQELAIAAFFSGDIKMQEAYQSGDFYLSFAKMAGAAPACATKGTHGAIRDQFKTVALGVLYGLSAEGLARNLGLPIFRGKELLRLHQTTFPAFWKWSQSIADHAVLSGKLQTVFGWNLHVDKNPNLRSLCNFPMQANGAEMIRLACSMATESGIKICCPVHDAVLIEAPIQRIDQDVASMKTFMADASSLVLGGFSLKSDEKIIRFPDRYTDQRGVQMWETVCDLCGRTAC